MKPTCCAKCYFLARYINDFYTEYERSYCGMSLETIYNIHDIRADCPFEEIKEQP